MKHYITLLKNINTSYIKIPIVFLMFFLCLTSITAQNTTTKDISQENVTISGNDDYIITGTSSNSNVVIIESGYQGTITLKNLTITHSTKSCITIIGEDHRSNRDPVTKVNIILDGTNTITYTGNTYCPIQVNQGAQVHFSSINPNDNSSGVLIAKNTGVVSSGGGGGAGIGAPNNVTQGYSPISCIDTTANGENTAGGNIIISSGTITAIGGHAAGIGGGWFDFYNGFIIIYGGVINSSALRHAAGIGSGCPTGLGVVKCYAENSTILALPPSQIESIGSKGADVQVPDPDLGLAGANNITYMNDPNKPEITVHTVDYEPNISIYLDLTETPNLLDIFTTLGIEYDLTKVKVGTTDADGLLKFRAQFEQRTTFFTDASSSQEISLGRPYMPVDTTVVGGINDKLEVILPLLGTEIAFTDYPSTTLEVGYTDEQAKNNAPKIKMEYKDPSPMVNVTFTLQTGADFIAPPVFLNSDSIEVTAPSQLNADDIYYIVLPLDVGKQVGLYSDVLLINGDWKSTPLPGYIRKIGEQKVIQDDTNTNEYIKVTATPNKFVDFHPASQGVDLTLNINHAGSSIPYSPINVIAKYIITTEPDYNTTLANTPASSWTVLNVPDGEGQDKITNVPFTNKSNGVYYIHWTVESGLFYAHSQTVASPPLEYGGFGPYTITDTLIAGSITGNPFVCIGSTPMEIFGEESIGGSEDFTYQWQTSLDGNTNWTDIGENTPNHIPEIITVSPTYYRRLTIDNQYDLTVYSNTFAIYIALNNQTLYWKTNASDSNWNNPDNWVDMHGASLGMVPLSCSNVFIPSGALNYPSLHTNDTPTNIFGYPECNEITFAYGSELAYQHKLIYQKAYIQYNLGYYDNYESTTPIISSAQSSLNRDRWYPLAAPLKKITSGDFAFGGYPFTWQSLPDGILHEDSYYSIDFEKSYSNNAVDLSTTNNSIALKIASYKVEATGYNNHKHIQSLNGILTIPYFENDDELLYHPGHSYDPIIGQSLFYNYDMQTLSPLYNSTGKLRRGNEAYRFVIENEDNEIDNVSLNGEEIPCYTMTINPNNNFRHALIGNPFIAAIDMSKFYEINSDVLDSSGYYIYESDNDADGIWTIKDYSDNNRVNSFQGFVVFFKSNAANQTLLFPMEGTYALTGRTLNSDLTESRKTQKLLLSVRNSDREGGDAAELIGWDMHKENVRKLINENTANRPEAFYIENSKYNLIQSYTRGDSEIGIGIRCSDTQTTQTLQFYNVIDFMEKNQVSIVLYDKLLNIEQDLSINCNYDFIQNKSRLDEQFIDNDRFQLHLRNQQIQSNISESNNISISYNQHILRVISSNTIDTVSIYDIQGRLVHRARKINSSDYEQNIILNNGVYIIRVENEYGEYKSLKLTSLD